MGGSRGRCSSCGGTRQQNSISHVGWRREGTRLVGAAHSGIVTRGWVGVEVGGMQLIRFGEMDHSLQSSPWEALTQNTPASVWFFKLEEFKKPKKKKKAVNQRVHKWFYTPGENKYEFYEHESGSNGTWGFVVTSQSDGNAAKSSLKFQAHINNVVFSVENSVIKGVT